MHHIYIIKNLINDKIYVGQTTNLMSRWSCHKYNSNIYDYPIYLAMRKYGIENFQFVPIESFNSQFDTDIAEKFWIDLLDTKCKEYGYNLKDGGSHGSHSNETKAKMSFVKIGKKASKDTKLKMSKSRTGAGNHNFGKKLSKEIKSKISKSVTLKVQGEDNPNAKLTRHLVDLIKLDYESGIYTHRSLGEKYKVSHRTIGLIVAGKIWKE